MSHHSATRELLAMDLMILNHGQVTRMAPELAPPILLTSTPHQWEDVCASADLTCIGHSTWRIFSGTRLELMIRQPRG
ncbi:hypothetical protein TNCV_4404001 [Trichonephila clavipes]|uniref:Uncharacterized protein n=1 Tax=Trichonephila clavipes TaxID=2585209 RepID=A0A8X6SEW0_TRICX|nr:hypothetical protein TNCV_4404001 [Trichonephila clavipes]